VKRRRWLWFLPESPDLLGLLSAHAAVLVEGLEALARWGDGDPNEANAVRAAEGRGDEKKRQLREELTRTFTTPLAPEDIFQLSIGIDAVLDAAKHTVREAEVMRTVPDSAFAEMARELAEGARHLVASLDALRAGDRGQATAEADLVVVTRRDVDKTYRAAMSALVDSTDVRFVAASRELYRRLSRAADELAGVGERVWYAVLKES